MHDMLAALNAALLPLSFGYVYNFVLYQYSRRGESQTTALSIFSWSLFCISIGVFISSILYFLFDFDLIYRSTQQKLGVLPRSFFVIAMVLAYKSLDFAHKDKIVVGAMLFMIFIFILKVVL